MSQIGSGRQFLEGLRHGIFDVLSELTPGLMLDVGAAAGWMTRVMLSRSPGSRVIAFEPFPGNFPHFEKTVGADPRVTLLKAAVAPGAESGRFFVARTVSGSEPGWEKMLGYSSEGFLIAPGDEREASSIPVDTVRIDDVIGGEHVRFMKIDVQGGELGVLRSAEKAIADGRVDFMFIEYTGDKALVDYLLDRRMQLFDSEYILVPRKPRKKLSWRLLVYGSRRADLSNWDVVGEARTSNGVHVLRAWPRPTTYAQEDFCRFFEEERQRVGTLWTDLIAVAPHFIEQFKAAALAAAAPGGAQVKRGLSS